MQRRRFTSIKDYTLKAYYFAQGGNFWTLGGSHRWFCEAKNAPNLFSTGAQLRTLTGRESYDVFHFLNKLRRKIPLSFPAQFDAIIYSRTLGKIFTGTNQ